MAQQHIATVTNVAPRHIQRANGQGFDLWEVFDSLGGTWVVKPQVAEFAKSLIGQTVTFVTRTEVKMGNNPGQQFTNHYADALYPGAPQPSDTTTQYAPQPSGMPLQGSQSVSGGLQAPTPTEDQRERTLSIYRQVAAKVAGEVCKGDLYVFWTLLPELMRYFIASERPASIIEAERIAASTVRASGGDPPAYAEGEPLDPRTDEDIPF
jgi:hypothetical protein